MKSTVVIVACSVLALCLPASALANGEKVCVPEAANTAVKTPKAEGECPAKYREGWVMEGNEKEVLKYLKYNIEGVDKQVTLEILRANLHIESVGVTGTGNVVIGGKAAGSTATGQNNLIAGSENSYTGEGNIIGGANNTANGSKNGLLAGHKNELGGTGCEEHTEEDVLFGEEGNVCNALASDVLGGFGDSIHEASGGPQEKSTVTVGGVRNLTRGTEYGQVVVGGRFNETEHYSSVVVGGESNKASGQYSSVGGGFENLAEASFSSVFGGKGNKAKTEYEAIP